MEYRAEGAGCVYLHWTRHGCSLRGFSTLASESPYTFTYKLPSMSSLFSVANSISLRRHLVLGWLRVSRKLRVLTLESFGRYLLTALCAGFKNLITLFKDFDAREVAEFLMIVLFSAAKQWSTAVFEKMGMLERMRMSRMATVWEVGLSPERIGDWLRNWREFVVKLMLRALHSRLPR